MRDASILAQSKIVRACGSAISEFRLIKSGDRVAIGLSGGKDSSILLETLVALRRRSPVRFDLLAFTINQGKFRGDINSLAPYVASLGIEWHHVEDEPSLRLLESQPNHGCDMCSRFRRTAVYSLVSRLGCNVIALGHTADDFAESLLRNIIYSGQVHPLPVLARSSGGDFLLIRPFVRVWEEWILQRAAAINLQIVPCACNDKDGARKKVRKLIAELQSEHPGIAENILAAALSKATIAPDAIFSILSDPIEVAKECASF
jgi:tRNA 2-thiocytidine biosynthesis protein TtcA